MKHTFLKLTLTHLLAFLFVPAGHATVVLPENTVGKNAKVLENGFRSSTNPNDFDEGGYERVNSEGGFIRFNNRKYGNTSAVGTGYNHFPVDNDNDASTLQYVAMRIRLTPGVTDYSRLEIGLYVQMSNRNANNHKKYGSWTTDGTAPVPPLTNDWQWVVFKTTDVGYPTPWFRVWFTNATGVIDVSDIYVCQHRPDYSLPEDSIPSDIAPIYISNDKVGIGTPNPLATLHIAGGNNTDAAILATATENNKLIVRSVASQPANSATFRLQHSFQDNRSNGYINFHRGENIYGGFLTFGTDGAERLRINANGNVGIGTNNPQYKLDVAGTLQAGNILTGQVGLFFNDSFNYDGKTMGNYSLNWVRDSWDAGAPSLWQSSWGGIKFFTGGQPRLAIHGNGNIGIGTDTPTAKLDVEGIVRAHEVKVCLNQGCDFVFEEDYPLMNLAELDNFIKSNKHLPDVAPAAVMESEGIDISEMSALLLRKIEELTLYVIEQNKAIETLRQKNTELERLITDCKF